MSDEDRVSMVPSPKTKTETETPRFQDQNQDQDSEVQDQDRDQDLCSLRYFTELSAYSLQRNVMKYTN